MRRLAWFFGRVSVSFPAGARARKRALREYNAAMGFDLSDKDRANRIRSRYGRAV